MTLVLLNLAACSLGLTKLIFTLCCRCSLFVVHPEEACKKEYLLDPFEMTAVYTAMWSYAMETLSLVVDKCLHGWVSNGHCGRYQNCDGLIYHVQQFLL